MKTDNKHEVKMTWKRYVELNNAEEKVEDIKKENERLKQLVGYLVGFTGWEDQEAVNQAFELVLGKDFNWTRYNAEFHKFLCQQGKNNA